MVQKRLILPVPRVRQRFDLDRWREQGFVSVQEAEYWGHRACGVACVAMLIGHFRGDGPSSADLLREGLRENAHAEQGWIHAGLARLLDAHDVPARAIPLDYPDELVSTVLAGTPFIASVTDEFPIDGRRGGHLVVVKGASVQDGRVLSVYFNDPSGWGETNESVDGDRFGASFAGRAVLPTGASPGASPVESLTVC